MGPILGDISEDNISRKSTGSTFTHFNDKLPAKKWTIPICYMYAICMLYVCYMYAICMLYVCYMYAICMLYVCYMYAICMLYVVTFTINIPPTSPNHPWILWDFWTIYELIHLPCLGSKQPFSPARHPSTRKLQSPRGSMQLRAQKYPDPPETTVGMALWWAWAMGVFQS